MMSKQLFLNNIIKAQTQGNFELGVLFEKYSATKEELANLLTEKHDTLKRENKKGKDK